jgi:hypothetical protein
MPFREPPEDWERAVAQLAATGAPVEAFPPLLVRYEQCEFQVSDGNHRHEAFKRHGLDSCWVIVWYPGVADFDHHAERGFRVPCAEERVVLINGSGADPRALLDAASQNWSSIPSRRSS